MYNYDIEVSYKKDNNYKVILTNKLERKITRTIRTEMEERLARVKQEIQDMEQYVREDMANKNLRDEDIFRINEKIKDLEKQILNVIEG